MTDLLSNLVSIALRFLGGLLFAAAIVLMITGALLACFTLLTPYPGAAAFRN